MNLLFSDLHCDVDAAHRMVELSNQVDVVIGAGDFAICRRHIERTVNILSGIDKPTIVVPGNSESYEELEAACGQWASAHVLHGSGISIAGVEYYGLGGAVPVTPFGDWSYDMTEAEAGELLASCPAGAVLVSHSPPKGVLDTSSAGRSLGSRAVLNAIHSKSPILVVCGHIHESGGKHARIERTDVINAGPHGKVWELHVC
jgi:Icc-related predicted phosphoesterase